MTRSMCLAAGLAVALVCVFAAPAAAHDDSFATGFSDVGEGCSEMCIHNEQDPNKGWFTATVTNTAGPEVLPWGDFHFELIRDLTGWGYNSPSEVVFDDTEYAFEMIDTNNDPWPNFTYVISPDNLKVDFFFYGDPVYSGDTVTFKLYTDNTANAQPFGMLMYPTPVPEPATMGLLALGALALLRRKR